MKKTKTKTKKEREKSDKKEFFAKSARFLLFVISPLLLVFLLLYSHPLFLPLLILLLLL
jgi:hypothetical protein